MAALTLEDLKALVGCELQAHAVPVPELGDGKVVYVAELGANESEDRIGVPWNEYKESTGQESEVGFRAFVVAACWCNESREFVAKTKQEITDTAALLGKLSRAAVIRMYDEAAKRNGLTNEDTDEKN